MSRWTPCKRAEFIRRLRRIGFSGPLAGARHQFMVWNGGQRLTIPSNPEYSVPQLRVMLREVEMLVGRNMELEDWDSLS